METSGLPTAVGLISGRNVLRIGVIFETYSANAEAQEPVVLRWDQASATFTIDTDASRKASVASAGTIPEIRRQ